MASSLADASSSRALLTSLENVLVQADEVDGRMLQFEGGLAVTADVVTGAFAMAAVVGRAPTMSKMQTTKFANYFLGRRSVQVRQKVLPYVARTYVPGFRRPRAATISWPL